MERDSLVPEEALSILKLFSKEKIPFLVVGGTAMVLHGIPRATLDIDILIPAQSEIIINLFTATRRVGFRSNETQILRLASKPNLLIGQWITFEDSKGREFLDIGLEEIKVFKKLLSHALKRRGEGITYYVVSLKDMERMKKVSGRPIDLADIALIQERRKINGKKKK